MHARVLIEHTGRGKMTLETILTFFEIFICRLLTPAAWEVLMHARVLTEHTGRGKMTLEISKTFKRSMHNLPHPLPHVSAPSSFLLAYFSLLQEEGLFINLFYQCLF